MSETAKRVAPPNLIQITDKALEEIQALYQAESQSNTEPLQGLRIGVKGGGCSGMSYKLAFDQQAPNDYVLDVTGVPIFIDPKSAIYIKGMTVDYQGGLEGKGFVFINPNATNTCGCGESFTV